MTEAKVVSPTGSATSKRAGVALDRIVAWLLTLYMGYSSLSGLANL
jgi:hypothetical protein